MDFEPLGNRQLTLTSTPAILKLVLFLGMSSGQLGKIFRPDLAISPIVKNQPSC